VVTIIESKRMMCDRVMTYYLTGEPLRGNIEKRKTSLKSHFFAMFLNLGGSFAKSFSLKCAQRFSMGKDVIY